MALVRVETVTRLRGTAVLDPVSELPIDIDWRAPSEVTLRTLAPAQPTSSDEPDETARNRVTTGYRLFLAEVEDVTAADRVRVRGVVHDVVGTPELRPGFALVVTVKREDG